MDNGRRELAELMAAQIEPRRWVAILRTMNLNIGQQMLEREIALYNERMLNAPACPDIKDMKAPSSPSIAEYNRRHNKK